MTKYVGILTAGGDSPGLNAAIRAVGRAAKDVHGMQVIDPWPPGWAPPAPPWSRRARTE